MATNVPSNTTVRRIEHTVSLNGEHQVEVCSDNSMIISNTDVESGNPDTAEQVVLSGEETYRLYSVLHAMYS